MLSIAVEKIKNALITITPKFEGMEFSDWALFFRNTLDFFIGRFTGIIWYAFPGVVCVFIYLYYRKHINKEEKILGDVILLVTLLLITVLIIGRPFNYFGGMDFVCNRYFFILPALLFLPTIKNVKRAEKVALMFLPGLIISSQLVKNEIIIKDLESGHLGKPAFIYVLPHAAHTLTFPLKYMPLEILQVESLPIYRLEISKDTFLYGPSDLRNKVDKKILLDKNQELVLVRKNYSDGLGLEMDQKKIILYPVFILKNKQNQESKSFYYFKAKKITWINDYEELKNE